MGDHTPYDSPVKIEACNLNTELLDIMKEEDGSSLDAAAGELPQRQRSQRAVAGRKGENSRSSSSSSSSSSSALMDCHASHHDAAQVVPGFMFSKDLPFTLDNSCLNKDLPFTPDNSNAASFDLGGYLICQTCFSKFMHQGFLVDSGMSRACPMKREYKIEGSSEVQRIRALQLHRLLCKECHSKASENEQNFVDGTLSLKSCSYVFCRRPYESVHFYVVNGNSTSGGKDWTMMNGWVLCKTCYCQYSARGYLKRTKVFRTKSEKQDDPIIGSPLKKSLKRLSGQITTEETKDGRRAKAKDRVDASRNDAKMQLVHDGANEAVSDRPALNERTPAARRRQLTVCVGGGDMVVSVVPSAPVESCGACGNEKGFLDQGKWFMFGCSMCKKCIYEPCIEYEPDSVTVITANKAVPLGAGGAFKSSQPKKLSGL